MSLRRISVAFLCLPAALAWAGFEKVEDFDMLSLGDVSGQSGWSATSGTAAVAVDPDDEGNQVLAVTTNSGIVRKPLTVLNGEAHMMFFRMRFGEQQRYSIGMSPMTYPSEFSDFGPEIGIANNSTDLRVWDDSHEPANYVEVASMARHVWYNVWVMIDNEADNCQVWANDTRAGDASSADQLDSYGDSLFGFRSSGSSNLIRFYIKTGGGSGVPNGPVYIDDIYLDDVSGDLNLYNPLWNPPGDANRDGFVDDDDLSLLLSSWAQDAGWGGGDFNGDNTVNDDDLSLLLANWSREGSQSGTVGDSAPIPEPATVALLTLASAALLRRRRR